MGVNVAEHTRHIFLGSAPGPVPYGPGPQVEAKISKNQCGSDKNLPLC